MGGALQPAAYAVLPPHAVSLAVQVPLPARSDRVDPLLIAGCALVAGGLMTVAPWEVVAVATAVVAAMLAARRARGRAALTVACGLVVGALRAGRAVDLQEEARARADHVLAVPSRCSARGRVVSSPVRLRDGLRWDAELSGLDCEPKGASGWFGIVTLYGGPPDLARGDIVDVVTSMAPPQRLWNPAEGDPRPSEAHRGVVRSGSAIDVRVAQRASSLLARIDRVRASVRSRIDATFASDLEARWRERLFLARAICGLTTIKTFAPAVYRTSWPSLACTWSLFSR